MAVRYCKIICNNKEIRFVGGRIIIRSQGLTCCNAPSY